MESNKRVHNKRATFDYTITEQFEAGLVLKGDEIKAFRNGKASLNGAYIRPLVLGESGEAELWLINAHFSGADEPDRSRKLLVHRHELDRLIGRVTEKGLTLVPIDLHLRRGRVKVNCALARGKRLYEKREAIRRRDVDREIRRDLKQ